ncbi:MgtC/SapB family protein, partial [Clostridioides difficile]
LERQLTGHPAGIRINVLICMGTSFFTLFPMLYGSDQVFRVGSSIISGVGFLCSGVIFKDRGTVRGMNTAATLWCTAAIGILASTGMYAMAITAATILIGSNLILRPFARKF